MKRGKRRVVETWAAVGTMVAGSCVLGATEAKAGGVQEFQGKIAKRYEDSEEWWPPEVSSGRGHLSPMATKALIWALWLSKQKRE